MCVPESKIAKFRSVDFDDDGSCLSRASAVMRESNGVQVFPGKVLNDCFGVPFFFALETAQVDWDFYAYACDWDEGISIGDSL